MGMNPHPVLLLGLYMLCYAVEELGLRWLVGAFCFLSGAGEKLSQSTADDVGQLVKLGVICYLKQLLDTGFFHADPHPGNLIRTPDGRLAILDFG